MHADVAEYDMAPKTVKFTTALSKNLLTPVAIITSVPHPRSRLNVTDRVSDASARAELLFSEKLIACERRHTAASLNLTARDMRSLELMEYILEALPILSLRKTVPDRGCRPSKQ